METFWNDIDAEELYRRTAMDENRQVVVDVMRTLTPDPIWTNIIIEAVESGRIETRCFISWLARELQPKFYLEVGVRRGFSMAVVAAQSPETEIFGFDMWLSNYAGVPNPGSAFVQSELKKIGYKKRIHLINGNSHVTLPIFFGDKKSGFRHRLKSLMINYKRPADFDLIVIDGDHSLLGAYQDLSDTMPRCAVGGAVVFDDILPGSLDESENGDDPHEWKNLLGVWHAIQKKFPNFRYFEFLSDVPGVGIAVRMK
jgi:predicted O-methyltransferase YrrM